VLVDKVVVCKVGSIGNYSAAPIAMADYNLGGTDEENAELKKLNAEVVSPHTSSLVNQFL